MVGRSGSGWVLAASLLAMPLMPAQNYNQNQPPQQQGYGPPPQQAGYGQPQQAGYGDPQQPGYGQPQQAGYGDPQQPGYSQGYGDPNGAPEQDPPDRVARVSMLQGNVSVEPGSVQQFSAAEINYPMTTGDRLYADVGAVAELQTGQIAVRVGQRTDLTVTALTDTLAQFGLAQGSAHLRTFNIYQGEAVELDTPNAAVTVLQAGDVRVNVDPNSGNTTVGVFSGQVQVNGNGVEQVLEPGEWLMVTQTGAEPIGAMPPDGLDTFSAQRDGQYLSSMSTEEQYVNPGTIGAADLTGYGVWQNGDGDGSGDDGPVWFPTNVGIGWQPYQNGNWTWVAPWGWTWVEAEPWGFAPFHYGRWGRFGGRWGWMPGPPIARPVYSPALVAFAGGGGFQPGLTAWFPLGPREPYQPWYHASGLYRNRVNVSNIFSRNVADVRNVYSQRTEASSYAAGNGHFANRKAGMVAVPHGVFAGGQRVQRAQVHVDPQQMQQAQVLPHPLVNPERGSVVGAPGRAMPPVLSRPVLASHTDTAVRPGAFLNRGGQSSQPMQGNYRSQQQGLPQSYQQQGQRQQLYPPQQGQQPSSQPQQQGQSGGQSQSGQSQSSGGDLPPIAAQQRQQQRAEQAQQQLLQERERAQEQLQQQREQAQQQVAPQNQQQPMGQSQLQSGAQNQQRVLFNKAVPPPVRPSFDQQRQAMQQNDPGRPLGPQQMENLRQNRPAGPAQQAEPPHPQATAPRNDMQRSLGPPRH